MMLKQKTGRSAFLTQGVLPMSSKFCTFAHKVGRGLRAALVYAWAASAIVAGQAAWGDTAARFGDVITIEGTALPGFDGAHFDHLALLACAARGCHPIPFQIDERDRNGHWVLDQGPEPGADDPPEVLDGNDVLLFMAADAGERARRADLPGQDPAAEIRLHDPLGGATRWAYLVAFPGSAPRSATRYVEYDAAADRVRGARVSLGFDRGVPRYLGIRDASGGAETNVLDRLKVRATATFLWGLIHFARNEDDLQTQFVAWREGPIRVMRSQRQWVRVGWGLRSPIFGSYTYFYRDWADLPVGLSLNFPPTYFFGDIVVRIVLDFRDLRGWSVLTASLPAPLAIDGVMTAQKSALNESTDTWFALLGPHLTFVQTMEVSGSLASVRRRLLYREGSTREPPETVRGEEPGIGYRLDEWGRVGAGAHRLQSTSYALPPDVDVRAFMATRAIPVEVEVRWLPYGAGPSASSGLSLGFPHR
jgi:hypothetical protein